MTPTTWWVARFYSENELPEPIAVLKRDETVAWLEAVLTAIAQTAAGHADKVICLHRLDAIRKEATRLLDELKQTK